MKHIILPDISLKNGLICSVYQEYLEGWLNEVREDFEKGVVAASRCLQGAFIEQAFHDRFLTDWLGIFDEFLTDDNAVPLSYSEAFGKKLYKYEQQYKQSPIHSIHARWWIDCATNGEDSVDHEKYAGYLFPKIRNGWIYDHDVSDTIMRHRMRSELTMSLAQSLQILKAADQIDDELRSQVLSTLIDFNQTGYMSAEYFRVCALELLSKKNEAPANMFEAISACTLNGEKGFYDFSLESKVDAYMGTAKRTSRDKLIHSPLTACHVKALVQIIENAEEAEAINMLLDEYIEYLQESPLDIPAFRMRDIDIPFGTDNTPIESICSSFLQMRGAK